MAMRRLGELRNMQKLDWFECGECGRELESPHIRCEYCTARFPVLRLLPIPVNTHTGPQPGGGSIDSDLGTPPGLCSTSGESGEESGEESKAEWTEINKGKQVFIKHLKLSHNIYQSRSRNCDTCGCRFVTQERLCKVDASGREVAQKKEKNPCWCSCKTAVYCGEVCQHRHWKQHKTVCPFRRSKMTGAPGPSRI